MTSLHLRLAAPLLVCCCCCCPLRCIRAEQQPYGVRRTPLRLQHPTHKSSRTEDQIFSVETVNNNKLILFWGVDFGLPIGLEVDTVCGAP